MGRTAQLLTFLLRFQKKIQAPFFFVPYLRPPFFLLKKKKKALLGKKQGFFSSGLRAHLF